MGDLTRAELRSEVNKNLGDKLAGLTLTDRMAVEDRLNTALYMAQLYIAREHVFKELERVEAFSTVFVGTPSIDGISSAVPANIHKIYSIVNRGEDGRAAQKLEFVNARTWDQMIPLQNRYSVGRVSHYTISINHNTNFPQFEWWMVPGRETSFVIRYLKWPINFFSDDSTSELAKKDDLLIARATEWMFRSTGAVEDATYWGVITRELLAQAVKDDLTHPDYTPHPRGASEASSSAPNYWQDPFVRRSP